MSSSSDRRWSWVYAFGFFQLPPSPAIKVKCISCGTVMSANSGGGTSHLQRHLTRTCKNQATRAVAQFVKKKVADHEAGAGRQLQRLSSMKGTCVHVRSSSTTSLDRPAIYIGFPPAAAASPRQCRRLHPSRRPVHSILVVASLLPAAPPLPCLADPAPATTNAGRPAAASPIYILALSAPATNAAGASTLKLLCRSPFFEKIKERKNVLMLVYLG
jgi:hypothetical protein